MIITELSKLTKISLVLALSFLLVFIFLKPGQDHDQDMMSPVAAKMTPVTGVVSKATFTYKKMIEQGLCSISFSA